MKRQAKKTRTFTVAVYEELGGNVQIEASSKEEAEKKARQILEDEGINGFPDFNCKNRECDIVYSL